MKFQVTGKGFVQDLLASFRSDDLAGLRLLLAEFQQQMCFFDLPPRLYLVPDANCVLKDLDFMCRRRLNPARSALEEVVDAGLVRLFAPFELEVEVLRHIPTIAANGKADPGAYFSEWERFKKKIRFFHARDAAPVEISDPDDACYLRASRIIDADAVVTDDEVVLDATTSIKPPVVHRDLRQISRDEAVRWGVSVQGALLAILSGHGLKALATTIYRKPKIGIPIAAVLGLLGYLYDRGAVKRTGTSFIREMFGAVGRGIQAVATEVKERSDSTTKRLESIGGDKRKGGHRPLEKTVHAVLIYEARPVAEAEIASLAQIEGFNPWRVFATEANEDHERAWAHFTSRIGEILRADPVFVWTGTGWTSRLLYPRPTRRAVPIAEPDERPAIAGLSQGRDGSGVTAGVVAVSQGNPSTLPSSVSEVAAEQNRPRRTARPKRSKSTGDGKRIAAKRGKKVGAEKRKAVPKAGSRVRDRAKRRKMGAKP
jgi:hypothetical protein